MAHKFHDGHHHTISKEHGSTKGAHGKFHKGAALKHDGHHSLIGSKGHGGMKAHKGIHGAKSGHFMASPSNVGRLGHK